jgi:hypothetical protein
VAALERGTSKEALAQAGEAITQSFPIRVVGAFSCGLAMVREGALYGYVNNKNKYVIPAQYEVASGFSDGYAKVFKNGKWGVINTAGQDIILCIYDEIRERLTLSSGDPLLCTYKNSKWGVVDMEGKEVIPCVYDEIEYYGGEHTNIAKVKIGELWGLISLIDGSLIQPAQYSEIGEVCALVGEDYESRNIFRARMCIDGLWGYFDEKGNIAIEAKFLRAGDFEIFAQVEVLEYNRYYETYKREEKYINEKGEIE